MAYAIVQNDISLLYCRSKELLVKIELLEKEKSGNYRVVDTITGALVSGDYSEDAESEVRRSVNFSMVQCEKKYSVGQFQAIWINQYVRLYFGQRDPRTKDDRYYKKGIYVFSSAQESHSGTDDTISVTCSDLVSTLDGTHNGEIDASEILIEKGSIIREAMIKTIRDLGGITRYRVDDIGIYVCLKGITADYLERRKIDPDWNQVPYDLEFPVGTTVWDIVVKLRDLYPGYETFFDEEGTFICQRIPNCDADDVVLTNDLISPLVISENSSVDLSSVRNATRIYGKVIETDRYSPNCSSAGNVYRITLDDYEPTLNTIIGVKVDKNNISNMKIAIVNNGTVGNAIEIVERNIYSEMRSKDGITITTSKIPNEDDVEIETVVKYEACPPDQFIAGKIYCFKYCECLNTGETTKQKLWVYQGQYQIQALYPDPAKGEYLDTAFSSENIGMRLQVLSGEEFDDITSDARAAETARYHTWLKSRLNETITLELVDIPFLTVNTKIEYIPLNSLSSQELPSSNCYIVKRIQESFLSGTMTVEMMKFYRLYPDHMGVRKK